MMDILAQHSLERKIALVLLVALGVVLGLARVSLGGGDSVEPAPVQVTP